MAGERSLESFPKTQSLHMTVSTRHGNTFSWFCVVNKDGLPAGKGMRSYAGLLAPFTVLPELNEWKQD